MSAALPRETETFLENGLTFIVPAEPPELTPEFARAFMVITKKAHLRRKAVKS